ncbi:hypothetical protein [Ezakiella coagulans]|uniref:hypothetical protein n=1 Tax=Ezakiella coagulans TaxID=46507 RepID=UPI00288C1A5E|nr:hypothetical protein [Ezakiella coagulans]
MKEGSMMAKKVILVATIVLLICFSSVVFAGGKVEMFSEAERYEDAIKEFKKFRSYSEKKLAKLANMELSKFKEFRRIKKDDEIHAVTPSVFKVMVCPKCKAASMKYIGEKHLEYICLGEQRACTEKAYGTDLKFSRTCQNYARCKKCLYTYSAQWEEIKWDCHGFNN